MRAWVGTAAAASGAGRAAPRLTNPVLQPREHHAAAAAATAGRCHGSKPDRWRQTGGAQTICYQTHKSRPWIAGSGGAIPASHTEDAWRVVIIYARVLKSTPLCSTVDAFGAWIGTWRGGG